jgi:protein gp37
MEATGSTVAIGGFMVADTDSIVAAVTGEEVGDDRRMVDEPWLVSIRKQAMSVPVSTFGG